MFKNLLVISDNLTMTLVFLEIFRNWENENKYNVKLSVAVSPQTNEQYFEKHTKLSILTLDLKKSKTIDFIIKNFDLVFSIHCKQLFPEMMVKSIKCINVHPGYNPINRGWYPQVFAILKDLPIGATIHEIDDKLDNGNIIDREFVDKEPIDTSSTLYEKILIKEKELISRNLNKIITNNYETYPPEDDGNLYLKKDFKELCKLDLEANYKVSHTINLLRALTHECFNNAYFVDPITKRKIFIKIDLKYDE